MKNCYTSTPPTLYMHFQFSIAIYINMIGKNALSKYNIKYKIKKDKASTKPIKVNDSMSNRVKSQ